MTEFFELFNPGARFQRQQRELDKTYVMEQKKGGRGPMGIDLDKGTMAVTPRHTAAGPTTGVNVEVSAEKLARMKRQQERAERAEKRAEEKARKQAEQDGADDPTA